jgi:hypothetical protein
MRELYKARIEANLDTDESVRRASLRVLELRRRNGYSTDPATWAAFVASGMPR